MGFYPWSKENIVNYIILMKVFARRNDVENEKNGIFYDETDALMHGFEIHS